MLAGEFGVTLETGHYNKGLKIGDGALAWNSLGFGPDIFGRVLNGGYMYGNAQNGALAFGRADGDQARIVPDDYGSVAGGHAYSDPASTGSSTARIVATAPGSFAHGKAYLYHGGTGGYAEVGARGNGAHAFGYAYSTSNGKASLIASGAGAMVFGYVYGSNPSTVATITATGKGSFAGGYSKESANAITASGKGAFQWGPGTNAVDGSLAVGVALRLNGPTGTPGALRNGDIWVASNYVYIRSNGVSKKIV